MAKTEPKSVSKPLPNGRARADRRTLVPSPCDELRTALIEFAFAYLPEADPDDIVAWVAHMMAVTDIEWRDFREHCR